MNTNYDTSMYIVLSAEKVLRYKNALRATVRTQSKEYNRVNYHAINVRITESRRKLAREICIGIKTLQYHPDLL